MAMKSTSYGGSQGNKISVPHLTEPYGETSWTQDLPQACPVFLERTEFDGRYGSIDYHSFNAFSPVNVNVMLYNAQIRRLRDPTADPFAMFPELAGLKFGGVNENGPEEGSDRREFLDDPRRMNVIFRGEQNMVNYSGEALQPLENVFWVLKYLNCTGKYGDVPFPEFKFAKGEIHGPIEKADGIDPSRLYIPQFSVVNTRRNSPPVASRRYSVVVARRDEFGNQMNVVPQNNHTSTNKHEWFLGPYIPFARCLRNNYYNPNYGADISQTYHERSLTDSSFIPNTAQCALIR